MSLDSQCVLALEAFDTQLPTTIDSDAAYEAALLVAAEHLEDLDAVVEASGLSEDDAEVAVLSEAIQEALQFVSAGIEEPGQDTYETAVGAVAGLGNLLAGFGAVDCDGLPGALDR